MFKTKHLIIYQVDKELHKREVYRVPNIGETMQLEYYGDRLYKVTMVKTVQTHDAEKNFYILKLERQ